MQDICRMASDDYGFNITIVIEQDKGCLNMDTDAISKGFADTIAKAYTKAMLLSDLKYFTAQLRRESDERILNLCHTGR